MTKLERQKGTVTEIHTEMGQRGRERQTAVTEIL
jgi:hypothetical protein